MPPRIFDKVALSIRSKMRVALGVNSSSPISGRQQDSKAGIDRGMHLWGGIKPSCVVPGSVSIL